MLFTQQKMAAIIIQKNFRMFTARKKYRCLRQVTSFMQIKWRQILLAKETQAFYMEQNGAAKTIQLFFRKYLLVKKQYWSAIVIQKTVRCFLIRRHYLEQRESVVLIQQWYRRIEHARCERVSFLLQRGAAITIQAWWRGVLCRSIVTELHHAATVIQANYKTYRVRMDYHYLRCELTFLLT